MKIKRNSSPEADLQKLIIDFFEARNWLVREVHGGARNYGWPDLRASHVTYGAKWVEVKLPNMKGSKFTKAQKKWFPQMVKHGDWIWIMTAPNMHEYKQLFNRPRGNLSDYW